MSVPPPIWASGTIAGNNSNGASTTTDAQVTNALWQDTNPNEANYLDRRHALVGANCMVNRYLTTVSVAGGTKGFENLVDKDLSNAVTFIDGVKADVGVGPSVTVKDVSRTYAKGTTAGFVTSVVSGLDLKVLDLPMRIYFYKDGKLVGSKPCVQGGGGVLQLTIANLSKNNRIEFTAKSDWDFDEIGLGSTSAVTANVGKVLKMYYAFVGKNGKYYIDQEPGIGIDAFKQATGFKGDITLSTWPKDATDLIDADSTNSTLHSTILELGNELDVCAYSPDGLPFKKGMEAGVEYGSGGVTVLGGSSVVLYNAQPSSGHLAHPSGYKWTAVNTKNNYSGSLIDVNLGGGRTTKSVIAEDDFNGIGFKAGVGINLGATVVYRMYVLLPVDMDDDNVLEVSADRAICEDTKEVLLNSNEPVTWTCNSADITLSNVSDTQWKATGFKRAGHYVFTATTKAGETKTTDVSYGIEKKLDLHMVPWVNNFTDPSTSYHVMSNQELKKLGLNGFTLIPLDMVKDTANLVNGSVDDYMTYFGGLQLAGSTVIACVKRTPAFTTKQDTRVGFIMKIKGETLNLDLLSAMHVRAYNGKDAVEIKNIDKGFKVLEASVAGSDKYTTTAFNVVIPAGHTFDKLMLYNNTVLTLDLSNIQVYYAFMEPESDAQKFDSQKEGGEIVSYKNGARIDEKLLNGFNSLVKVASYTNNYTNFIDGNLTDSMTVENVASVAGKAVYIPVKLGKRYDGGHQVVIYTENLVGLADVDLAKVVRLYAYLNGEQVDALTNWNALDAKVIGVGGGYTMRWTPKHDFDEIVVMTVGVANALQSQRFYGIRIVSDVDRDGIPDSDDDDNCPKVAFLIDENESELNKSHDFTNSKMYLHRTFNPGKWSTICLPVDLTYNQFANTFGSEARLATPVACKAETPNTIQFDIDYRYGNQVLLQKNKPYIIRVGKTSTIDIPDTIKADNTDDGSLLDEKNSNLTSVKRIWSTMTDKGTNYLIHGVSYDMQDNNRTTIDCNSIDHTPSDAWKATHIKWYGTYVTPQAINESFYSFRQTPRDKSKAAELVYVKGGDRYFRGLRCWMTTDETTSGAGAKELSMAVGNEIISDGTATGINEVNQPLSGNGNIYTLTGVLVRQAATSTEGLSKGIYIWNNKKIEIK